MQHSGQRATSKRHRTRFAGLKKAVVAVAAIGGAPSRLLVMIRERQEVEVAFGSARDVETPQDAICRVVTTVAAQASVGDAKSRLQVMTCERQDADAALGSARDVETSQDLIRRAERAVVAVAAIGGATSRLQVMIRERQEVEAAFGSARDVETPQDLIRRAFKTVVAKASVGDAKSRLQVMIRERQDADAALGSARDVETSQGAIRRSANAVVAEAMIGGPPACPCEGRDGGRGGTQSENQSPRHPKRMRSKGDAESWVAARRDLAQQSLDQGAELGLRCAQLETPSMRAPLDPRVVLHLVVIR